MIFLDGEGSGEFFAEGRKNGGGDGFLLGKTERVEGEFRRGGNEIPAEKTERVEEFEERGERRE